MAVLGRVGVGVFLFFLGAAALALLGIDSAAFGLGSLALIAFVLWDRFSEFFQAAPETYVFFAVPLAVGAALALFAAIDTREREKAADERRIEERRMRREKARQRRLLAEAAAKERSQERRVRHEEAERKRFLKQQYKQGTFSKVGRAAHLGCEAKRA